jgi:hypothetical protein
VINTKHFVLDYHPRRPDGRRFKFKHNQRAHSLYLQVFALEFVLWYR